MRLRDLPVVSNVVDSGADDRVFDSLLLLGPVVIGVVALVGRSLFTEALAVTYLAAFVTYTLYRGIRGQFLDSTDGR
jgi:hypothetical protein